MEPILISIIELDKDDNKYLELLKHPWFVEYNIPENNKIENIKSFLYKIFEIHKIVILSFCIITINKIFIYKFTI